MATGELLSTFFPSWLYIGRCLNARRKWKFDPYYWINFHAHPVLSSYYPPNVLMSSIGAFLSVNSAFKLLARGTLLHTLFGSIGWFLLANVYSYPSKALFLAIFMAYGRFFLKIQPCVAYTLAWAPWAYLGLKTSLWIAGFSFGMMFLSGYYPLAIYLIPLGLAFLPSPVILAPVAMGVFIGSPQLIPFIKYLPKTVKANEDKEPEVGDNERSFFFGITPILVFLNSPKWYMIIPFLLVVFLCYLAKKHLPRVPKRAWIIALVGFYWTLLFTPFLVTLPLVLLLCFELYLFNRDWLIPPGRIELYQKPSWAFFNPLTKFLSENSKGFRVSGLPHPLFTGHVNEIMTLGYCGTMQNKMMAKWRGGEGHDKHNGLLYGRDSVSLDTFRCKYAFSRTKLDWPSTGIKHLYRNPRM